MIDTTAFENDPRLHDLPRSVDPTEYLNPELWRTPWDTEIDPTGQLQYEKGLRLGRESERVFIAYNGTWGAIGKDGTRRTSYEKIGFHRNTADLLRGFLDSGVPFYIYQTYMSAPPIGDEEERGAWINKPQ